MCYFVIIIVTPVGHDVPVSIVAWVKVTGTAFYTLFGLPPRLGGAISSITEMGIQFDIQPCAGAYDRSSMCTYHTAHTTYAL